MKEASIRQNLGTITTQGKTLAAQDITIKELAVEVARLQVIANITGSVNADKISTNAGNIKTNEGKITKNQEGILANIHKIDKNKTKTKATCQKVSCTAQADCYL